MFETVTTKIANTTMEQFINSNGERTFYRIKAVEGYVLHTKGLDREIKDEDGNTIATQKGYTKGYVTCAPNYDFATNPRELFAVAE